MSKIIVLVVSFIGVFNTIGAQIVQTGQCNPNIPLATNFNIDQHLGTWYEIATTATTTDAVDCSSVQFNRATPASAITYYNRALNNHVLQETRGTVNIANLPRLTLTLDGTTVPLDFWILITNNVNYTVAYRCENVNPAQRRVFLWQLGVTPAPLTGEYYTLVNTTLYTTLGITLVNLQAVDHSPRACLQLPVTPGQPIILPGQCDVNIPVVSNFNLQSFSGEWHEISSYYSENSIGACSRADYTVVGNMLNIVKSQVVSQELNTITGTATVIPADGSGRLQVVLNTQNGYLTQNIQILGTDYDYYAVAYSCTNLVGDIKRVYSWILGKSRVLSAASEAAVNNVINAHDDLNQSFYQDTPRTDADCFYFPEALPEVPVVFRGQCDTNIPVVTNFDRVAFSGVWRDIESYNNRYTGSCNEGVFNIVGANYEIGIMQVVNQSLERTNHLAAIAADGSGRLTVNTANGPVEYWILATDYTNFTLIYSCNNVGNDSRQVMSWKLSRARNLSAGSQTAINAVVNDINVLDVRYYNTRNHDVDACFYLPDAVPGVPVTFRGTCPNMHVVQNFLLANYTGIWSEIESYPQDRNIGTCATAEYLAGATAGSLYVINSHVINHTLYSINGTATVTSTDGSAQLSVSLPIPGTNLYNVAPYRVLATDYISYSLVYSCSQSEDPEYVNMGVWKLSRQRTLTAAAHEAINAVVNNITNIMLRPEHFEPTIQTEEACTVFPHFEPGEPIILDGQCPQDHETNVVLNFNATAFAGTWYEMARFPSQSQNGECISSTLVSTTPYAFTWTQSLIYNERMNTRTGSAASYPDGRGVIAVTLSGSASPLDMNLHVLGTDNTNYALLYGCNNVDINRKQIFSWKLSRSQAGFTPEINNVINNIITGNIDLHETYYQNTDHNDGCFHYPVFNPLPDAIVLPGMCDGTIQGQANLNLTAYTGRWFEIERYPTPSQSGACTQTQNRVTPPGNVIEFTNSQVFNQTLETVNGVGVIAADGRGVLTVSIIVNGVPVGATDYYVLETDYNSYALLYSCRNINNESREVSSWKLSRTRVLTPAAGVAIDRVVNATQGLLQDYYITTSQNDVACFYIPEMIPDRAPVFRGTCENVAGMNNFNIQAYVGWWHEIERYQVDGGTGDCISSRFEQTGATYRVVDTNVEGLAANADTFTVTADNTGLLTRTYADGTIIYSRVLATDYSTYSLLYSCTEFNDENNDVYRRVWSAKHSKTRQLTQAAQNAMAPTIENNRVLFQDFYIPVNQTDGACFHYPLLPAEEIGQRVILPGQCNVNIGVVSNFNVSSYTGVWYLIDRYPYPQITPNSYCIGTRYTLNQQLLNVVNWEMVNNTLSRIDGSATVAEANARLSVTLPTGVDNNNVTTDMYVLATDYTVFSVMYTCENVNSFERAIVAFLLSRTREIPDAATNIINNLISDREELHRPYFRRVTHNDDCVDAGASLLAKSSIIVMLICAIWQILL